MPRSDLAAARGSAGVVVGQGRLGVRLVSLIATLREVGRLPLAVIQSLLQTLSGLRLSVGGLVRTLQQVAARAEPVLAEVEAAIRDSPVVHLDETGWRENGRNSYICTASTPTARHFMHGGQAKAMLERALGNDYAGVLAARRPGAGNLLSLLARQIVGQVMVARTRQWKDRRRPS